MKRAILLTALIAASAACASGPAVRDRAVSQPAATVQPPVASAPPAPTAAPAAATGRAATAPPAAGTPQRTAPPTPVNVSDLGPGHSLSCTEGPNADQVICPVGSR